MRRFAASISNNHAFGGIKKRNINSLKILFASQNPHKVEEVKKILPSSIELIGLNELAFEGEIPEEQDTIEGNALQKVRFIHERYALPCFADDTGLFIEALNGEPGVHSARWYKKEEVYENNIHKALDKMKAQSNRKAYFKTVIAYIDEQKQEHLFEGICEGELIDQLRGSEGFGYDPLFIPQGYQETFAEMSSEEKNKISHRGLAMDSFIRYLSEV
jgi:XTP/dITP diphosphohydrolase